MIQDIAPHRYQNEYAAVVPKASDCLIGIDDAVVYMSQGLDGLEFIRFEQLDNWKNQNGTEEKSDFQEKIQEAIVYLFAMDGISYFLVDPQKDSKWLLECLKEVVLGCSITVPEFRKLRPIWKAFCGITAVQLHHWYQNRKYCGHCGTKMEKSKTERAMICPECGLIEYPKICPAVIVAVTNGDQLMLTKYAGRAFTNYALIAGFTEIGESFEATVKREVMEEVGLKVKNICYYKSQPWAFSDTILAGFFCQLDGDEECHMDANELSAAEWISREEIPLSDSEISLTGEMIEAFRRKTYPQYEIWEKD